MVNASADANSVESSSMEQVRELLFGAQFKEMEISLQRQDERVQREMSDMRDLLKSRLDSLENFMKSEIVSILARISAEKEAHDNIVKDIRHEIEGAMQSGERELAEVLRIEQNERMENIKAEQNERLVAVTKLSREFGAASEAFDRKLSALSASFDSTERELRQLLLAEGNNLSGQMEDRYQQVLDVIRKTAEQIRQDTVSRSAISAMFMEAAVKFNNQLASDLLAEASAKKR